METSLHVYLQSGLGLIVPLKGSVPFVPQPPRPPVIDYGAIEEDLVRLAERVPRLMRGGLRRTRRLPAFTTPTAGRLSLQVRKAAGRGRSPRLAAGARELETGQTGRLRFSITRQARKLLRLPRRTRVQVRIAFKAHATGETFRQALELTIRRPASEGSRRPR